MAIDLQALYPKLIQLMPDALFVVDPTDHIVFVSDACEALLGYRPDEMIGTLITHYMHPDDLAATRASIERVMNGQPHRDFRNRYVHKDGHAVYILWSAFWSAEVGARIGVARDVTALAEAEAQLRFLAHHDPLTRVSNRALFNERLDAALRNARRYQHPFALVFLDVNDFKGINDRHGHAAGDRVLCEIARRLRGSLRETDTVARLGGDEFVLLLTGLQSPDDLDPKLAQLRALLAQPLEGAEWSFAMPSCSFGVACYPRDGLNAAALLKHADGAMYHMKHAPGVQRDPPEAACHERLPG
ncbi:sensor domain-containing diguanylate cyclase [Pseudomonas rhizoryzae]|uniref:sensor domain-containing diguanylate cyclase n=1 Tax=Pseudomonas rhizoryzae TaxID=2571129 RepID=UPI0009BC9942|nr:sensor domain-containing diguanylate cyclase [Pseudomonas rhizoryzae]